MELSRALGSSEWQEDNVKMHSNTIVPHRTLPRPTKKLLLAVISCVIAAPISAQSGGDVARSYREVHEVEILKDFAELLSYPNSARDLDDITRAAEYIRDELLEVGVDSELLQLEGVPPIVYGELNVPGATRTLGIYVHYDGQPVDPSNWTHPPFEPTLYTAPIPQGGRELPMPDPGDSIDPAWRLYARSAGDDKAPIAALLPVLRAFRESGTQSTSNLILFFDGEEEAGSRNLPRYMETFKERLDPIDIWLFFDGPAHPSGRPQITFGVRGSMGMEVTVYGATRNLHSGHYGNWAPDTGVILSRLLVSMKDETGRVLVDGWYDTADLIGDEERAALAAMPAWDNQLKRELGIVRSEGEPESLPQRLMVPALNIRGITSGNTGALARNVIPNTAVAALGIRLVKGNEPEHLRQLIIDHIQREGFHVISEDPDMETRLRYPLIAKVTGGGGSRAARTSMSNPFAQSVMAAASVAADRAFGQGSLVVAPGMGGTLPITPFTEILQKPAIIVPVANHDNNQHAPDENLRIANLWYAIDLYAQLLTMPATIF
ncbi:MAG TPA: M20/M25/M40 family metallo-hydrolase [Gemmatimonadetes bacterium]|nr:M20/M25/M40 family metallo-hydrolase [Gemmatimonadota bacterium]